jgi:zinc protease
MSRFQLPPVGSPSVIAFPSVDRRSLDNGMGVWSLEQSASPVVTVACLVDAGTASDPPDRPGLMSLTAVLLTEGAGRYDAIELSDALARIGGQLETEVGTDISSLTLTVLSKHFEAGLALLAEVARRPRFDDADFRRARELRLSRLKQVARTPAAAADRALLSAVYGDHPYGHGALGTTRSLERIDQAEVRACWGRVWQPASTVLLIAGHVTPPRALGAARHEFGDWNTSTAPQPVVPAPVAPPTRSIFLVHRPGSPQSEIRVGHLGPARVTPDYHALVTLNAILGGQFTSRINRNLRETRAITYGARSSFDMRRSGGLFSCDASVQPDATAVALAETVREMRDVGVAGAVSASELDEARASLTRGYARHFETTAQLARAMAQMVTYGLDHDTFDRFVPEVERLTPADIARAATALRPDDTTLVVVGDADQVRAPLETLGRPIVDFVPEF